MNRATDGPRNLVVDAFDLPLDAVALRHRAAWSAAWTGALEAARREIVERERSRGHALLTEPDGTLPPLYRLEGHSLEAGTLVLETSTTDYAAHLLTNVEHPEWRESRGDAVMADALGVSGLLVTADRRMVIGRRSGRTHEAVGAFHVAPSGHPHPPQTIAQAFHAELEEELGVRTEDVRGSRLTGLIRARPSGKPELTARLDVDLEAEQIVERWSSAVERWEFESLEVVDWTAPSVTAWLAQHGPQVVAPGYAAITLAARADFGEDFSVED